jgi:hypothetical protein
MITRSIPILLLLLVVGCGGDDLGNLNTEWTKRENDLFVKLNNVKGEYATLRTTLTRHGGATAGEAGILDERLSVNERSIREIEDMIGRHRDARARAMEGGNAESMKTAWNSAEADYKGSMAKLDELESQRKEIDRDIAKLPKADARNDNGPLITAPDKRVDRDTAVVLPNAKK